MDEEHYLIEAAKGKMDPTCDFAFSQIKPIMHKLNEYVIDPSCNTLSASRLMFILINVFAGIAGMSLVMLGFYLKMPQAFTPAAVIFTGLAASDASVYFASTRKQYKCNGVEQTLETGE